MASPLSSFIRTPTSSNQLESPTYFKQLLCIKDAKLKKLRQLYEDEINERNDLVEDHDELKKEVERLKNDNKAKSTLIQSLNESLLQQEYHINETNEEEKLKIKHLIERKYKSEVSDLERLIETLSQERNSLKSWKDKNESKLKTLTKELNVTKAEVHELVEIKRALLETVEEQNQEIHRLKTNCNELREMFSQPDPHTSLVIEESFSGTLPDSSTVPDVPESLAIVVELQLQDKIEENEKLTNQLSNMQESLKEKVEALSTLQKELDEAVLKIDQKSVELKTLNELTNNLQSSLSDKTKELEETKETIIKTVEENRSTVSELDCRISELQCKISDLSSQNNSLERDFHQSKIELQTLSSNLDDQCSVNKNLSLDLESVQTSLSEKLNELSLKQELLMELEDSLQGSKLAYRELEDSKAQVVISLNEKLAALQNDFEELSKQNIALKDDILKKCTEWETLNTIHEKTLNEKLSLEDKLNTTELALNEKSKDADDAQLLITELKEKLNDLMIAHSELEESKTLSISQLKEDITKLNDKLKQSLTDNDLLSHENDEKNSELAALNSCYDNERHENQRLLERLSEMESTISEKMKELVSSKEHTLDLEDKLKHSEVMFLELEEAKNQVTAQLNEKIMNLQKELSKLSTENNCYILDIEQKSEELSTLRSSYESKCQQNQCLDEKLINVESSLAKKIEELINSNNVSSKLKAEFENLEISFTKLQEDNALLATISKKEITELQTSLKELKDQNVLLKQDIDAKTSEFQSLSSKFEEQSSLNEELKLKLDAAESSLSEKSKELKKKNKFVRKLEGELSNLKKTISELEINNGKEVASLKAEISKLQSGLKESMAQSDSLKNEISDKVVKLEILSSNHEKECCINQDLGKKLNGLEILLNERSEELTESKKFVEKQTKELKQLKSAYEELEESSSLLTSNLKEEVSNLLLKVEQLQEQNGLLNEDLNEKCSELLELKDTFIKQDENNNKVMSSLKEENSKLQNHVDDLSKECDSLKQGISVKAEELETLSSNYEEQCSAFTNLNNELESLKATLNEKLNALSLKEELIMKLEDDNNKVVSSLKEENSKLQNRMDDLSKECDSLKQGIAVKAEELETMSSNYEEQRSAFSILNNELDSLKATLNGKLNALSLKEELIMKLEDDNNKVVSSLKEENSKLQNRMDDLSKECDSLKQGIAVKAEELETMSSNYEEQRSAFSILNNELESLKGTLNENLNALSLKEELIIKLEDDNNKVVSCLEEKNSKLQNHVDDLSKECDSLKQGIAVKAEELETMSLNYEKQCSAFTNLNNELESLKTTLNEKLNALSLNEDLVMKLEDDLKSSKIAYSELEESKLRAIDELNKEREMIQRNASELLEQNISLKQVVDEKCAELQSLSLIQETTLDENQCLKNKLTELEISLHETFKDAAEARRNITELENELKNLKLVSSELEESKSLLIACKDKEISDLQSLVNELTQNCNALKQDIVGKSAELEALSSGNNSERCLNKDLNIKLNQLEISLSEKSNALAEERVSIAKLKEKSKNLELSLAQLEENKSSVEVELKEEIAKLQTNFTDLTEQKTLLMKELNDKATEFQALSSDYETERTRNRELNEKCNEFESLLNKQSKELSDAEHHIASLENELKDMKSSFVGFAENNNQVVTNMKEEFNKLESFVKELTIQNSELKSEVEIKAAEIESSRQSDEKASALKEESTELKEAYNKLLDDFERQRTEMTESNEALSKQVEEYRDASHKYELKWKERMKQVKEDYEGQLTKIKEFMTKHYHDKLDKQGKEADEKLKMYKEKIAKDQDCIKDLSSQIWNLSEKFLQAQQEIKNLTSSSRRATISRLDLAKSPDGHLLRSMSVDHLRGNWEKEREKLIVKNDSNDILDEVTITRRRKLVPPGIGKKLSLQSGKVFPSEEDEDGEFFDAACLADLKEGRVRLSPDRDLRRTSSRLTILQQRNSLCPPHLKSSYPAETQFLHPAQIREEDIKGSIGDCSDTGSLISNPDRKKKDAGQTLYKKPGPPTPSKHGGRSSHGGGPLPRSPVENKENIPTRNKHPSTPSKIMNFFRNKIRRDERAPVAFTISPVVNTPSVNRTRRSGFFGKQSDRV